MEAFELIFIGNVKINNSLKDTSKQGNGVKITNLAVTVMVQDSSDQAHLRPGPYPGTDCIKIG